MQTLLIAIFVLGYLAIIFEDKIRVNKSASALCTGVVCWAFIALLFSFSPEYAHSELEKHLAEIASITFFLIGAMTIVELIDAHDGFRSITDSIKTRNKRKLIWIVAFLGFFLSAALDNLTTTIVMVSLLAKLVSNRNERLILAAIVVIAANAGGAWSPIGDVTTTMLWMGGQISAGAVITHLFIPSLICMIVPLTVFSFSMKGEVAPSAQAVSSSRVSLPKRLRRSVLILGLLALLSVPVFKTLTDLPPYMGMALALGIMWVYTELIYRNRNEEFKSRYSVTHALSRIDMTTIMFFLGILLCVAALQSTGILLQLAGWLTDTIGSQSLIVLAIGIISAVIDNVPLVAASQAMYSYPMNDFFWLFLTYAAGTGGSILIIGSAAGLAAMGMEKINFLWYLRKVSFWALLGYLAGALAYIGGVALFSA